MSTDARPSALVHATEELLEEYSFGRICEPQLGWLEEHLLICARCQSELDDIDEYKILMRAGLARFERERQAGATPLDSVENGPAARSRSSLKKVLSLPFILPPMPVIKNLLVAGLLIVLAGATVWRMKAPAEMASVATVKLVALRGGEGSLASAPAGHPLDLVFGGTDLPADVSYRAAVIDSWGSQMWSGNVRIADQNLSIGVGRALPEGAYWVRLYSSDGQLLREFGLRVG